MIYTKVNIPADSGKNNRKAEPPASADRTLCAKTFVFNADKHTCRTAPPPSDKTPAREAPSETPPHAPEIVTADRKESDFSETSAASRPYRHVLLTEPLLPFSGKVALLAALCLVSFLFGCTVTDQRLCRVMMAVSAAASGRLPAAPLLAFSDDETSPNASKTTLEGASAQTDSSQTYYQKYRAADAAPHKTDPPYSGSLDYLTAHEGSVDDTVTSQAPSSALPVGQNENGKIGADDRVLYPVLKSDLRAADLASLTNQTRLAPEVQTLLQSTPSALQNLTLDGSPLVLIVHTHGTEGYNECETEGYYDASLAVRSEDVTKNVVSVGASLAEVLNDFGIATLHDTTMCDKASFVRAYKTSAALVRSYLEQYPSLRFVIDLHRDAIIAADGTSTAPTFSFAGEDTAQLMLVVGTNDAGADHPHWSDNLSLALHIQKQLSEDYPGLFRKINLRAASFNEQLSSGYLLLECGSIANKRSQAERAAKLFGTGLARMILCAAQNT